MESAPSDDQALSDEGKSKKQSDATEDTAEGDSSQEETEASKTGDGSRDKQDNCVCVRVYVDHFRVDLARLLKKEPEQLGRIRKVEGSPPKYSLVDVVVCITGKTRENAKHAIDEIVNRRDRDVCQKITDVNLIDSRGRHNPALTPVADIQTVLRGQITRKGRSTTFSSSIQTSLT